MFVSQEDSGDPISLLSRVCGFPSWVFSLARASSRRWAVVIYFWLAMAWLWDGILVRSTSAVFSSLGITVGLTAIRACVRAPFGKRSDVYI